MSLENSSEIIDFTYVFPLQNSHFPIRLKLLKINHTLKIGSKSKAAFLLSLYSGPEWPVLPSPDQRSGFSSARTWVCPPSPPQPAGGSRSLQENLFKKRVKDLSDTSLKQIY